MKTRKEKIRLDRLAGRPLALGFNFVARILGWLLRRDHTAEPERVSVVVVAKFVGMGSVLQATPFLRALRVRFPAAKLIFMTGTSLRPLMDRLSIVDEVLYVDDSSLRRLISSTGAALLRLIRSRVDLYFDLEVYSAFSALVALTSMARNRFGFYRDSARFKLGIYTHLLYFNTQRPIRRVYLQLGATAGAAADDDDGELGPIDLSDAGRAHFRAKWHELAGVHADVSPVAINANASDLLIERRWPVAHFVRVIEELTRRGDIIALTGAPDEAAFVAALTEMLSPTARSRCVDTSGRLSFEELCFLLESAACVVTNDTGPMHLAIALHRPTVCLFGPCSPAQYGTVRPDVAILYRDVFCSPCIHHTDEPPCAGDNVCMQRIEPAEVIGEVDRLRGRPAAELPLAGAAPREISAEAHHPLGLVLRDSILGVLAACPVCAGRHFSYRFRRNDIRLVKCSACGLERIDPPPADRDLAEIYSRDYYKAWGLHRGSEVAEGLSVMKKTTFQRHVASLSRKLPADARILDCGAATGFFMDVAAECGLEPYGVELSEFGAKEIARKFGADRVFCGDLSDAVFPAVDRFSAIFMLDFLEHVRDPRGVLERSFELLAPGGSLLITTPDTGSWTRRAMGARWTHYKLEHLYYFSRRNLATLLEQTSFRVVHQQPARKVLTLRYFYHQFSSYRHWLITPLVSGAYRLLPERARDAHFRVPVGEMLVEARKEA